MRSKVIWLLGWSLLVAPVGGQEAAANKVKIGLSLDTLKEERWQHDRDLFVKECEDKGAEVLVQAANNDDTRQISQAENLLTEGVQVLVVVPHNGKVAATIVDSAHKAGVKVVAYDRLIRDCDLDYYVAFDAPKIGELQAQYLVKRRPKGNYILIEGAPTDNNAALLRDGQMKVLKPYLDSGVIKLVTDQWANDWSPIEALKIMENALTRNNNQVDAVLVSNDGMAGGVVQALAEQGLAGKVPVTGQDGDMAACQRIVAGTQSMTIYKPLRKEATEAADLALGLARNENPDGARFVTVNNGKKDVPSLLLAPVIVDQHNLDKTIIADGFQKKEDVYKKQ
jgi:D-xylose transport system substrate-binding protein